MSKEFQSGDVIVNKYRIERNIGKGGLGAVYLATDVRLGRPVAIKTLLYQHNSLTPNYRPAYYEQYVTRFEQEATISSYFTGNPNVITVFGLEQDSTGDYFLIMEYLEGGSLADLLKREGRLTVKQACQITLDICHALTEIHRHPADIVHRDLKPSNILFRKNGQAVVADFGIAQVGHQSRRAEPNAPGHPGSSPYMSPEQQGANTYLTPASDLYAVGLMLYEILTGRMFAKVRRLPPSQEHREIPAWLDKLVGELLETDQNRRMQPAEALASRLKTGLAELDKLPGRETGNNFNLRQNEQPLSVEQEEGEKEKEEKTVPLRAGLAQSALAGSDANRSSELSEPLSAAQLYLLEKPEGTMDTHSAFYIERPSDRIAMESIKQVGVTITIKGPRQMGKSSLLLRVCEAAKGAGKRVALFDFQLFDKPALSNPDLFFRQLCDWVSEELELPSRVEEFWEAPFGNSQRTSRYLQRYVLKELNGPLVLAMDEVDRTFDTVFRSDFFGMLRSWHNSRHTSPLWKKLDLVLVTSTEPYQLIEDLNQSPFNVGEVIELSDFTPAQVAELNRRHGSPLSASQLEQLMALLNGHPYLVRRALYLVASGRSSSNSLFSEALSDRGPFGDHLRNQLFRLHGRPELVEGLRQVIHKHSCPDESIFFRLRGAGLVKREGKLVVPRCQLYAQYFQLMSFEQMLSPAVRPVVSQVTQTMQNQKAPLAGLSERELEVLRMVAEGLSSARIAEKLVLSNHTVNSHLSSIYSKLEVNSRTEAVHYAREHKLI